MLLQVIVYRFITHIHLRFVTQIVTGNDNTLFLQCLDYHRYTHQLRVDTCSTQTCRATHGWVENLYLFHIVTI